MLRSPHCSGSQSHLSRSPWTLRKRSKAGSPRVPQSGIYSSGLDCLPVEAFSQGSLPNDLWRQVLHRVSPSYSLLQCCIPADLIRQGWPHLGRRSTLNVLKVLRPRAGYMRTPRNSKRMPRKQAWTVANGFCSLQGSPSTIRPLGWEPVASMGP